MRQLWLHRLMFHHKYPVARLAVEYPVTFGRDGSKRADIVAMDADRPTVPYLAIESGEAAAVEFLNAATKGGFAST